MKQLIIFLTLVSLTLSVRAEDFTVLWEMDIPPLASVPRVSDDGKYFYFSESGFVNFHDSETGIFLHQINQGELNKQENGIFYLNDNKVVLPFTLDSILIYNIATRETEATIDLGLNVESPPFYRSSLSPNKRFLTLYCRLEGSYHFLIVDLKEKRLFKDANLGLSIGELFNTNDPNRMIVVTSDQFGKHLMEITLDETAPLGYKRNIFEEVGEDGEIRGQKYDANEDALYYLYLPSDKNHKMFKYNFNNSQKGKLLEWDKMNDLRLWYNSDNKIYVSEKGFIRNLENEESIVFIPLPPDGTTYIASACDGLETILIREFTSLQHNKLRRVDVSDFLTDVLNVGSSDINLYPNPTNGDVNLIINNQHPNMFNYSLFNEQGQVIHNEELGFLESGSNAINIQLPEIPNGMYILKIESSIESFDFKIIKER